MLCVHLCISPRLLTDSGVVSGKPLPGHIKTGHGRVYSVLMAGSGVRRWCSRGPLLCFWIHLPRAAITKYYRLHGLTFIIIIFFHFLTVWEARSLRSRCEKGWFPLGLLFLACRWLSSSCVPTWPSFCIFVFVFCSVAQSCLTLCVPMDCSTPGFPVLHHLLEFAQTHAHESVMPSNHLVQCCALLLLPSISPSISVSRLPLPIRIFIMFGFWPTLMTSCLPSSFCKGPISKCIHTLRN